MGGDLGAAEAADHVLREVPGGHDPPRGAGPGQVRGQDLSPGAASRSPTSGWWCDRQQQGLPGDRGTRRHARGRAHQALHLRPHRDVRDGEDHPRHPVHPRGAHPEGEVYLHQPGRAGRHDPGYHEAAGLGHRTLYQQVPLPDQARIPRTSTSWSTASRRSSSR